VSAEQQALLECLSCDCAGTAVCSWRYGWTSWCLLSSVLRLERMVGLDAASSPHEPKSRAELRTELDEYLFGSDGPTLPPRRVALRSDKDGSNVNPGYREVVWNTAKKRAENVPGVGPADLCNQAYSSVLHAIDRGTKPQGTMGQFYFFYLERRTRDAISGGRVRDRAAHEELRYLISLGDPLFEDEIERLRGEAYWEEAPLNPELDSDPTLIGDAPDLEADDRAQLLNRYRLCVEECADGMKDLSAVLTWTTLATNPDVNLDGVPKQTSGAHVDEWERWPALWFSCRKPDLFKGDHRFKGDDRRRRTRSRELRKISELRSRAQHLLRTSGVEL